MAADHEISRSSTTEGLPVSPSLGPTLAAAHLPPRTTLVDHRIVVLCLVSIALGAMGALIAQALMHLIGLITNLSFYGRWSWEAVSPAGAIETLGLWIIAVPIIGALIIGLMARYGSAAIRGHGIPEAMEQVLTNKSRIPPRVTLLKPLSAAISIGTGGPFGAEGPIIATGGALGSLLGQIYRASAVERKTLLAAGAAAGMAATFGSPVSAVLLAIELLLFEFRPRSFLPVAFASATAAGIRIAFEGAEPIFAMPDLAPPGIGAMAVYIALGALVGLCAVGVTRAVYFIEDSFEKLPIHWMWWPAVGAVAVGVVGYFAPRTLGVGYDNISHIVSNDWPLQAVAILCLMKFISWSISLGSGTSGGTLAPLFTIGGALGALMGAAAAAIVPAWHVDLRVAALVGMAAIFAGASRALLASVIFAFETTLQPMGLLPLLGGCSAAYLVSCFLMQQTIMTEKIARRGVCVPAEYAADILEQIRVSEVAARQVVTLAADDVLAKVRQWINHSGEPAASHQGFPVVDASGLLMGVVTRRDLLDAHADETQRVGQLIKRPPVLVYEDCSLREAADHLANHNVGRLPVVRRQAPGKVVGILTRSDILLAFRRRVEETQRHQPQVRLPMLRNAPKRRGPQHQTQQQ
ncbi:MAG TPA: chloride channel protein [Phycisphaeraceae bacterium]